MSVVVLEVRFRGVPAARSAPYDRDCILRPEARTRLFGIHGSTNRPFRATDGRTGYNEEACRGRLGNACLAVRGRV